MEQESTTPNQRRFFLSVLMAGAATVLGTVSIWPIWQYLSPRKGAGERGKVTLPRSTVAVGESHFFNFAGRPAVVLQPAAGDFVALSAVCTHLGCIVQWQADKGEFLCPCHAGRFSARGEVLAGPPPKPLETLAVALQGDQIVVG